MTDHGSTAGYSQGCRDVCCKAAKAAHERERRAKGRTEAHGVFRYRIGCRCQVCVAAKAEARRRENTDRYNETRRARYRRIDGELFEAAQIWRARRPAGLAWQCALELGVDEEQVLQLWELHDEIASTADGAA